LPTIVFLRTSAASKIRGKSRHRAGRDLVRTNNHVERTNRKLRFFEKSRYKWRRRRNIVRFLLLAFTHWREKYTPSRQRKSTATATTSSQRKAA
jgi:hypothetical protein